MVDDQLSQHTVSLSAAQPAVISSVLIIFTLPSWKNIVDTPLLNRPLQIPPFLVGDLFTILGPVLQKFCTFFS